MWLHTDSDGLDLDAFLDMRGGWIIDLLVSKNLLAAEGVYKGGSASS